MKLTRVTLTGADDSIAPEDLFDLSSEYPFVEWGILLSYSQKGYERFPSNGWLERLVLYRDKLIANPIPLSGHLCGRWLRETMIGDTTFLKSLAKDVWKMFGRVQLNTHGVATQFSTGLIDFIKDNPKKEFIFQYDDVNKSALLYAKQTGLRNISALFDLSHGGGVLPTEWPEILPDVKCGYAGGLSRYNVVDQIGSIAEKAGDREVWIDLETHVRTGKKFDLDKCAEILELCAKFISK